MAPALLMNNAMLRTLALIAALTATVSGCSRTDPPAAPAAAASQAVPQAAAPLASAGESRNVGKVLQVLNGGGYTYAEVAAPSGQSVWLAGSQIEVKAGDALEWGDYSVMRNFSARTLGRTFDEILFVSRWGLAGGVAVATSPHGSFAAPPAAAGAGGGDSGVVKSVTNAGGYSYIEVDRGGSTVWVAATEASIKAGDRIQWQGGSEMRNFTAKSLSRTFERIIFTSSVAVLH